MTVQPADIEPEDQRAVTGDWRRDPGFVWPERVPWSELGQSFAQAWGTDEEGRVDPEHVEIVGPTGSGKTYLLATMLQAQMMLAEDTRRSRHMTGAVMICTKPADGTVHRLGWPIHSSLSEAQKEKSPAFIFWPDPGKRMGTARREYHEAAIRHLLDQLWREEADTIVAFDEVGYVESLSGESRSRVQQYWREGRSLHLTVAAMKQRPQGALRDMHSETFWTASFPPKDRSDTERFAELFGAKRDWVPVLDDLDRNKREFVIRHARSGEAYISWVDKPLAPARPKDKRPVWLRVSRG